jgi:hypothetical protein
MRYFKVKRIITDTTTLSFNANGNEMIVYDSDDIYDYVGVNVDDSEMLLVMQNSEIEAEELSYETIKPILENCKKMLDYDLIIEAEIAKKYTVGREFKMKELPITDPKRIEYEAYKEIQKAPIRLLKIEKGLLQ